MSLDADPGRRNPFVAAAARWPRAVSGRLRAALLLAVVLAALLAGSLSGLPRFLTITAERMLGPAAQDDAQQPVRVGLAWYEDGTKFFFGAAIAARNINARGGILGRPLELVKLPSLAEPAHGGRTQRLRQARSEARWLTHPRRGIHAVIGHRSSSVAIPAASIYDARGMLYLAPTATLTQLTGLGFRLVLRPTPDNREIADQMAAYAEQQGYRRLAVLAERTTYGNELSRLFIQHAVRRNLSVMSLKTFFPDATPRALAGQVMELRGMPGLDALALISANEQAVEVVRQMRKRQLILPIIGSEALDAEALWDWVDEEASRPGSRIEVMVPTVANLDSATATEFTAQYRAIHDDDPDRFAALAFDAVELVARGMRRAGSTDSHDVAAELRFMPPCQGVLGVYAFDDGGDLKERPMYAKQRVDGEFRFLPIGEVDRDKQPLGACNGDDLDGDGVEDTDDHCPNDAAEAVLAGVDETGCPRDADGDGIPDDLDQCAGTRPNTSVDGEGCAEAQLTSSSPCDPPSPYVLVLPDGQSLALRRCQAPARPESRTEDGDSVEAERIAAAEAATPELLRGPIVSGDEQVALIMAVQRMLEARGYDPGSVDGRLGARTLDALRAFQRDVRLPDAGISFELLDRLQEAHGE